MNKAYLKPTVLVYSVMPYNIMMASGDTDSVKTYNDDPQEAENALSRSNSSFWDDGE